MKPTLTLLASLSLAFLTACAGTAPATSADAPQPADFWLAVTVMGPVQPTPAATERLPRALRPARYVLEPDRVLRAGLGAAAADTAFPPRTRQLSVDQHADVWRLVASSGLMAADHPAAVSAAPTTLPAPDATVYVLSFHAAGAHGVRVLRAAPEPDPDTPRAAAIADRLAELAWIKEAAAPR